MQKGRPWKRWSFHNFYTRVAEQSGPDIQHFYISGGSFACKQINHHHFFSIMKFIGSNLLNFIPDIVTVTLHDSILDIFQSPSSRRRAKSIKLEFIFQWTNFPEFHSIKFTCSIIELNSMINFEICTKKNRSIFNSQE